VAIDTERESIVPARLAGYTQLKVIRSLRFIPETHILDDTTGRYAKVVICLSKLAANPFSLS
jgi:hypothetical protein